MLSHLVQLLSNNQEIFTCLIRVLKMGHAESLLWPGTQAFLSPVGPLTPNRLQAFSLGANINPFFEIFLNIKWEIN